MRTLTEAFARVESFDRVVGDSQRRAELARWWSASTVGADMVSGVPSWTLWVREVQDRYNRTRKADRAIAAVDRALLAILSEGEGEGEPAGFEVHRPAEPGTPTISASQAAESPAPTHRSERTARRGGAKRKDAPAGVPYSPIEVGLGAIVQAASPDELAASEGGQTVEVPEWADAGE